MAKVIWTKRAFQQLEKNIKFIQEDRGRRFAEIVLNQILESTKRLEHAPLSGTKEPLLAHKKTDYRFLIAFSYKIIYRVSTNKVIISRVFHMSRNPEKLKGV